MGHRLERTRSYNKVKTRRGIEICILISLVVGITITTVTIVTMRNVDLTSSTKCGPESPHFSVNITGAEDVSEGVYKSDGVVYRPGTTWRSGDQLFGCPCSVRPCVRKCCEANQSYVFVNTTEGVLRRKCVESNATFNPLNREIYFNNDIIMSVTDLEPIKVDENHFYIMYGVPCDSIYQKFPAMFEDDQDFLLVDGRIYTMYPTSPYLDQSQYCLETINGDNEVFTFECFENTPEMLKEEQERWIFDVLLVGLLVSIPCLICTFVVYAFLPQQRNLHGKCLMSHVACLSVAYTTLACVQFPRSPVQPGHPSCVVSAFIMQYSFLGSFFWLNVMCFDIWWVFSGLMSLKESTKKGQTRKFILYSIYSWGLPLLPVTITATMEYASWVPTFFIKPQLGINRCWFYDFDGRILYFYLPIGVIVVVNLVMFSTTSFRLHIRSKDIDRLNNTESQRHNVSERHRFLLYLNLFIVMGVTWILEVVSFGVGGPRIYWLPTDLINSLQGVFIFVIFVCKRRILYQINRRICPGVTLVSPAKSTNYNSSRTSSSRISSDNVTKLRNMRSIRV